MYMYGLSFLFLGGAVLLSGCHGRSRRGQPPPERQGRVHGEEDLRTAFVKDVIVALRTYNGEMSARAKAIADELDGSTVVFDRTGEGFSAGEWRYDQMQRQLVKTVMSLPNERTWVEVKLSVTGSGSVQIECISEQREHFSAQ